MGLKFSQRKGRVLRGQVRSGQGEGTGAGSGVRDANKKQRTGNHNFLQCNLLQKSSKHFSFLGRAESLFSH